MRTLTFNYYVIASVFLLICATSASSQSVQMRTVRGGKVSTLPQQEKEKVTDLELLIVNPNKQKYRKKGNPAVELIEKIREQLPLQNPRELDYYSFSQYEKYVLGLNDINIGVLNPNSKSRNFYSQFIDTALWTGKRVLNLSLKEELAKVYAGKQLGEDFKVVNAQRRVGLDEDLNQNNIRNALGDFIKDTDIYGGDLVILQNHFVSPLSTLGLDYYKYEITDSVLIGDSRCVEITFVPHNPESYSFNGRIYVPVNDSLKYVRRIVMRVPHGINLNFVRSMYLSQNYEKKDGGKVHKTVDTFVAELQPMPNSAEVYACRLQMYDDFNTVPFDKDTLVTSRFDRVLIKKGAEEKDSIFWELGRPRDLSWAERNMSKLSGGAGPSFKMDALKWLLTVGINDHVPVGNPAKIEIGPVSTAITYNEVEGMRFCVGGITTPKLWNKTFVGGYMAYGNHDHRFKYMGEVEFSFREKDYSYKDFPVHSINLSYRHDVDKIGQKYDFTGPSGFLSSFTRMENNMFVYATDIKGLYTIEMSNNFSVNAEVNIKSLESTEWVPFVDGNGVEFSKIRQPSVKLTLRYSPGQNFLQGIRNRGRISMEAPIFALSQEYAPAGFLNSRYTLNKTEGMFWKRLWFSSFGYSDIIIKGGIVWDKIPFTFLPWQNSNITYTVQPECFNLLNPMELAMDRYFSWDLTYYMNGTILNRIPMINKLKLREVIGFKGFAGELSSKNDSLNNSELLQFPHSTQTRAIGKKPYMEVSAGIENIFSILRLDYIWRLSYLDSPGISRHGLRVGLHFSF